MINKMLKKLLLVFVLIFALILLYQTKVNAFTIVLDPGHGGLRPENTEAIGCENGNLKEREITLKIGLFLKEILERYDDVNVVMTRTDDSAYTIFERATVARKNNADLFVSLHINDSSNLSSNGVEVWVTRETCLPKYQKQTYELANKIANNINDIGINKRTDTGVKICSGRSDPTDIYSTGMAADYYGVIAYAMRGTKIDRVVDDNNQIIGRNITWIDNNGLEKKVYLSIEQEDTYSAYLQNGEGIPSVLIEHAFIHEDSAFLDSDEDLQKLAIADANAIIEHYDLKLKHEKIIQTRNKGDINNDGEIDIFDVISIIYYIKNISILTEEDLLLYDFDDNREIDIFDVINLLSKIKNM